jgi:hypothetical protein
LNKLQLWIRFLSRRYPKFNNILDTNITQNHLDHAITRIFHESHHISNNSLGAAIDIQSVLNVDGADDSNSTSINSTSAVTTSEVNSTIYTFLATTDVISDEDSTRNLFISANNELQMVVNSRSVNPLETPLRIQHGEAINEFTNPNLIFEGPFKHLFCFGYPFTNQLPSTDQQQHMLMQATNAFSNNSLFVSYLFNLEMRLKSIRGARSVFKYSPDVLNTLAEKLIDPVQFQETLYRCIK